jgi:hypothetical protein
MLGEHRLDRRVKVRLQEQRRVGGGAVTRRRHDRAVGLVAQGDQHRREPRHDGAEAAREDGGDEILDLRPAGIAHAVQSQRRRREHTARHGRGRRIARHRRRHPSSLGMQPAMGRLGG